MTLVLVKGKGKKPYTVSSVYEFYDDCFIETAQYEKIEFKYPVFESICIHENSAIYLNYSKANTYLLPYRYFESQAQQEEFIEFIKTKCDNVVYYK